MAKSSFKFLLADCFLYRPLSCCRLPLFQSKCSCKAFRLKMSLFDMKMKVHVKYLNMSSNVFGGRKTRFDNEAKASIISWAKVNSRMSYCFYQSKIKLISSRRRVIISI